MKRPQVPRSKRKKSPTASSGNAAPALPATEIGAAPKKTEQATPSRTLNPQNSPNAKSGASGNSLLSRLGIASFSVRASNDASPAKTKTSRTAGFYSSNLGSAPTISSGPGRNSHRPGQKSINIPTTSRDPNTHFQVTTQTVEPKINAVQTVGGRLLLIGVIVLMIFVVIFTPLRNWMELRSQAQELALKVENAKNQNEKLSAELKRWEDPDYTASQARSRLGYVRKGETTYILVDSLEESKNPVKDPAQDLKPPWFNMILRSTEAVNELAPPQNEPK